MLKKTLLVCGLAVAAIAGPDARQSKPAASLTTADYVEIQQLYARYMTAVDSAADNGYAFARTFTPDGRLVVRRGQQLTDLGRGHEQLAEVARRVSRPTVALHFGANVVIEPSQEGAAGTSYGLVVDFAEGKPHGGRYQDVIVKTPEGWRFRQRTYTEVAAASAIGAGPR